MGYAGGRFRLRELIRRYHPEIRADLLSEYGVDLGVWLASRRYRSLLILINQLPDASRLNEAVQNDPEQAERIARSRFELEGTEDEPVWSPKVREFSLVAMLLREVRESINRLHETTASAHGGKLKIPPMASPETEIDRALIRIERAWSASVLTRYGFKEDQL